MKRKAAWEAITKGDGITDGTFHAVVDGGVPQLRVNGRHEHPATFDSVDDLVDECKQVSQQTGSKWKVW
jgi:hypothetical protein